RSVGDQRDRLFRRGLTFKKWKTIRIEKITLPCRHAQIRMCASKVDGPKQRQQLRPCPISRIHRVRVGLIILPKACKKAVNGIVLGVECRDRKESTVFGEQDEDQPHKNVKDPLVNVVWILLQGSLEEFAFRFFVRALKAADHLEESFQDLLGQLLGNTRLIFAALCQEGREPRFRRNRKKTRVSKQFIQRGH